MKLTLIGHDYKYAAEQIMLTLFPTEKPEYGDTDSEKSAEITLKRNRVYASAHTRLFTESGTYDGYARVKEADLTDEVTTNRLLSRIIKLSFYKAAIASTGKAPVWGALTGVRPGKLVTKAMDGGMTAAQAGRYMQSEFFVSPARAELCVQTAQYSIAAKKLLTPKDISLYVGIPFCPTRCAYCSFVSNSIEKSAGLIPPFIEALGKEIAATGEIVKRLGLNINSVYIGGGTPTTLSADELKWLMSALHENFDLPESLEFTVEAGRPDTITREKLLAIKDGGATRISINPQTMSDEVLKAIGRRHSAEDILKSFEIAREIGIGAINMDLIAGLPADTPEGFYKTLDRVMALEPENITVHTLSLKKGTQVTLEGTKIPTGEEVGAMLDYAAKSLKNQGFMPYYLYRQKFMSGGFENVGWTKPGFESLYNIYIMEELCSIVALGGGGSTKLVSPVDGKIERVFNAKYPTEYISGIDEYIQRKNRLVEFYEK